MPADTEKEWQRPQLADAASGQWGRESLPFGERSAWQRYGFAILVVTLAILLRWLSDPIVGDNVPFITAFGAVALATWYGGLVPGICAIGASYLGVYWLFIPPRYSLVFNSEIALSFVLYLLSTFVIMVIVEAMRRAQRQARANAILALERQRQREAEAVERKRAEEALREINHWLQLALKAGRTIAWNWDLQSGAVAHSQIAHELLGIPASQHVSASWMTVHPDDSASVRAVIERALAERSEYTVEFRFIRPDNGELMWLQNRGQIVCNAEGEPIQIIGTASDITARKQAEAALSESEERFRALANGSPALMWVNGLEGCEFVNRAYLEYLNLSGETDVHGYDWAQYVHPEDREHYLTTYLDCFARRTPFEAQFRFRRHDGEYRWMHSSGLPRFTANGEFCGYVGSTIDITPIKQAEETFQENEKRMAAELEAMTRLQQAGEKCARMENDFEQCSEAIVETAIAITGADKGNMQLYNPAGGVLFIAAQRGFERPFLDFFAQVRHDDSTACGMAMLSNRRVVVKDVTQSEIFAGQPALAVLLAAGVRAVQATPLISSAGNLLGMISTHFTRPHQADERALRLMDLLARQAADYLERKQAEAALRENESRLRLAMEAAQQGSWEWNTATDEIIFSPVTCKLFGVAEDGPISFALVESKLHPADREAHRRLAAQSLETGIYENEYRVVMPDDSLRWIRMHGRIVAEEANDQRRMLGVVSDVTERKRIEEALLASEGQLRIITDSLPVLLSYVDGDLHYRFLNKGYELWFGPEAREFLGKTISENLGEQAFQTIRPFVEAALDGEAVTHETCVPYRLSGSRWIHATYVPDKDKAGTVKGFFEVVTDISKEKQNEEALRAAQRQLQIVADAMPIVVTRCSRDLRYLWVNKACEQLLKRSSLELVGRPIVEVLGEQGLARLMPYYERVFSGEQVRVEEEIDYQGLGRRWVDVSYTPTYDHDGEVDGWVAVVLDISERKHMERALRQLNANLEARVRLRTRELETANRELETANRELETANRELETARQILESEIAERIKNEAEIAFQASLIAEMHDAVIGIDPDSVITYWNPGAEVIFGWTAQEALGRSVPELLRSEFLGVDRAAALQQAREQGHFRCEVVQRHKNGQPINIESSIIPLGRDGQFSGFFEVNRDVTARKQAQERLAFQASVLSQVSDAVIVMDEELRIAYWNTGAEIIYGWKAEEALRRFCPEVLGLELNEAERADHILRFQQSPRFAKETMHYHKDGHKIYIESNTIALKNEAGKITGYVAVNRDVTARKLTEAEIHKYAARLQILNELSNSLAAASPEPMMIMTTTVQRVAELIGEACSINLLSEDGQRWKQVAVYHPDPDICQFARELAESAPLRAEQGLSGRVLKTGKSLIVNDISPQQLRPTVSEKYWPFLDRYTVFSNLAVPLRLHNRIIGTLVAARYSSGNPYTEEDRVVLQELAERAALVLQNAQLFAEAQNELKERRTAQENLHLLNNELERRVEERTLELRNINLELTRALRTKDEFLAAMSHELRTPLNTILAVSEALTERIYGALNERQLKALRSLEESGRHLLSLINDILDLFKMDAGRMEFRKAAVSVRAICDASLRLVSQMAQKKNLHVRTLFDTTLENIEADERRLKQILVNLLNNAVKFTSEGGTIGLEVIAEPAWAHFTVWDTGIGIAAEDLSKLFQPFVQLDSSLSRQYPGTGMGLVLVQRMVEMHGGRVTVESEPGKGSRFTVSLPIS